jgi:hypothetical protein
MLPVPSNKSSTIFCPDCAQDARKAAYAAQLATWRTSGWHKKPDA